MRLNPSHLTMPLTVRKPMKWCTGAPSLPWLHFYSMVAKHLASRTDRLAVVRSSECMCMYVCMYVCTLLYSTLLYSTLLYCTVLYCTVLYCTVLNCTVLYCTVLYCTVLYTALYVQISTLASFSMDILCGSICLNYDKTSSLYL